MTDKEVKALVEECGLEWRRGYIPLFHGDPTNRYAVLVVAATAPLLERIAAEQAARIKAQEENISLKDACLKAESQAQRVPVLLAQIAELTEERDQWKNDAMNGAVLK